MANLKVNSDYLLDKAGYAMSYPIGSIVIWTNASTFPDGWLLCDGTTYNISDYTELGNHLGATYGGNGTTTFAVPPLVYHATNNPNQRYAASTISVEPSYPASFAHNHSVTFNAAPTIASPHTYSHTHITNTLSDSTSANIDHSHPTWPEPATNSISTYNTTANRSTSTNTTEYGNDAHSHPTANTNVYLSVNYPNTGLPGNNVITGNNPVPSSQAHVHGPTNSASISIHGTHTFSHNHTVASAPANQNLDSTVAYPYSLEVYFLIKC